MAQRRMFSKSITSSGKFLKMPPTSRLLYYDLGMNADDDGYAEWFTVIRMSGSTEQDLKVLHANGFIHIFDENVLIIKDWKENNQIRKDRYTPSRYLETHILPTLGLPNGNQMATKGKPSIGKVRLGKDSIGKDSTVGPWFEKVWKIYPNKDSKKTAQVAWSNIYLNTTLVAKIMKAIELAKKSRQWKEGYIPHLATYLRDERWNDEVKVEKGLKILKY